MKGYILKDKEVEEEAKKARKAKKQGQWIVHNAAVPRMCWNATCLCVNNLLE
jgi:hypothetical protein